MSDLHSTTYFSRPMSGQLNLVKLVQVLYVETNVKILMLMSVADLVMLMIKACPQGWFAQ